MDEGALHDSLCEEIMSLRPDQEAGIRMAATKYTEVAVQSWREEVEQIKAKRDELLSKLEMCKGNEQIKAKRDELLSNLEMRKGNELAAEVEKLKVELAKCQDRCRIATQIIIGEIGAYGPESLESAIGRIVVKLTIEQKRAARLRGVLEFIAKQDKPGNWAVELANRSLEEDQA